MFLEWLHESLLRLTAGDQRKTKHDADFEKKLGKIVSPWNGGFSVNGSLFLSIKDTLENVLIIGGTGTGKSSAVLVPGLLNGIGSASYVVNDVALELAEQTAAAFASDEYTVRFLSFTDSKYGHWNPMAHIKTTDELRRLCSLLITTSMGSGGDAFWLHSSTQCLELFSQLACTLDPEYHCFSVVLQLINLYKAEPKKCDALAVKAGGRILAQYKSFVGIEAKTQSNIIATTLAAIGIFANDGVAAVTSKNDIDFETFRKEKTIVFLRTSILDQKYFGVLTSIFFSQLWRYVLAHPPTNSDIPIFSVLDECASMDLRASLPTAISTLRKVKNSLILCFQSISQIKSIYSEHDARTILENTKTKLYMPGIPYAQALEISQLAGDFEFETELGTKRKALLTASEIHELTKILMTYGNKRLMLWPIKPAYESQRFQHLLELPTYYPKVGDSEPDTPPFLNL